MGGEGVGGKGVGETLDDLISIEIFFLLQTVILAP